jgi:hypothetical protein
MGVTDLFMSQLPLEDRKLFTNPFGRAVGDPLEDGIDVQEINREAFEACRRLIEDVRSQHSSGALTLFGDAGTGKTHLLGRVRRWLGIGPESLFVPVRMDTSARMLWRHLRRNLADALLRLGASGERALDRLLRAKRAELDGLPERDLAIVLQNLLSGNHVRDAAAWLRGQELPESTLIRMDLAQPGPEENQEASSRNAIVSLCSSIDPGIVVFCLDQWEALQTFANDRDGLFAAGQAVSFLHDPPLRNVCIICCVQSGFMHELERLDEAIQQRLLRRRQGIHLLDWDKARRLISARLDDVPALSELRRGHDSALWPLSEAPIRPVFTANAAPARKVISQCKDLFDQWRTGEESQIEPFDAFLQRMLEERMTPVEPADAEAVLRNGLPLLLNAVATSPTVPRKGAFDFSLHNGQQLIAFCNQANGASLAARLRKIGEAWSTSGGQRLLLFRDARLPIGAKADKTRQRLKSIEEKGGRLVALSQESVESLAALRRLLADAQSGDLAYRGDPVSSTRVEQWIAGHLPTTLEPLVSEIEVPDLLSPKLADLLAKRKIVSLHEAAHELESRPEEVESCARRDPRLFGVLGGSTPALFQPVEAESAPAE